MASVGRKTDPVFDVPLLDLKPQYHALREPIQAAIRTVCDSQQFILGPAVARLEERIARYCQARFAVGVSSGTDALLVSLMALGVGPGDEVVTSAYSFFATGEVIARLGARPVFCDVDPGTFNLDPQAVADFLGNGCRRDGGRTVNTTSGGHVKALIPVHLFGQMADMDALSALAAEYGLQVIEDAAQAIGAETPDGRRAGSIGDIGCLSFFPSKNLGAFGDAGMCVTQSAELAGKIEKLRVHGAPSGYRYSLIGGNFRLDTIQAAVLEVKLEYLDAWTAARQAHAMRYSRRLDESGIPVRAPRVRPGFRHVFNQYVIDADDRDALQAHLRASGIGTAVYYPMPLHLQECFVGDGGRACPVAERFAERSLAIPIYPELTLEQQDHVLACVAGFYEARRS